MYRFNVHFKMRHGRGRFKTSFDDPTPHFRPVLFVLKVSIKMITFDSMKEKEQNKTLKAEFSIQSSAYLFCKCLPLTRLPNSYLTLETASVNWTWTYRKIKKIHAKTQLRAILFFFFRTVHLKSSCYDHQRSESEIDFDRALKRHKYKWRVYGKKAACVFRGFTQPRPKALWSTIQSLILFAVFLLDSKNSIMANSSLWGKNISKFRLDSFLHQSFHSLLCYQLWLSCYLWLREFQWNHITISHSA